MSDESDLREFWERVQALKRDTARQRGRWAALQKAPGGAPQLTTLLKNFAGLEGLLTALDNVNKPADPDKMTQYDKIRAEASGRQHAHPDESIPLDERLRRGGGGLT